MKAAKWIGNLHQLKNDPIGTIIDTLVALVVNLIVPIPLAGQIVTQFKGPVIGCLASIILIGLFTLLAVGTIFVSVLLIPSGFLQSIISSQLPAVSVNEGFIQSSSPTQNPLGGAGMAYTSITAGFMDPGYYIRFGKNHTGIDLIPNNSYYKDSKTYQETKKVVVYATHTGKAVFYTDENGGETVEVINNEATLKTIYIHFKTVYVSSGDTITAGKALGEMGRTGRATGEHVHYEIRIKDGATWRPVNPLTYIR